MEMITAGAEKIINRNDEYVFPYQINLAWSNSTFNSLMINDAIDAIIQRKEERTVELNGKYEDLNLDDLNNFKSDATVQQWEGEDFRSGGVPSPLPCTEAGTLNEEDIFSRRRKH
jgi:SWI/SNF-related matrix-associated actin-dependent regulator of chromatin subfamily A member 5